MDVEPAGLVETEAQKHNIFHGVGALGGLEPENRRSSCGGEFGGIKGESCSAVKGVSDLAGGKFFPCQKQGGHAKEKSQKCFHKRIAPELLKSLG